MKKKQRGNNPMGKCRTCGHPISQHLLDHEYQDDNGKTKRYAKNTYHRSCMVMGCCCSKIVKIKPIKEAKNK